MMKILSEICKNCGLTFGAHCGMSYHSDYYKMFIPRNYCPGNQGRMNWDKGPGTVFKSTGKYEIIDYNTPANSRKETKEDD